MSLQRAVWVCFKKILHYIYKYSYLLTYLLHVHYSNYVIRQLAFILLSVKIHTVKLTFFAQA